MSETRAAFWVALRYAVGFTAFFVLLVKPWHYTDVSLTEEAWIILFLLWIWALFALWRWLSGRPLETGKRLLTRFNLGVVGLWAVGGALSIFVTPRLDTIPAEYRGRWRSDHGELTIHPREVRIFGQGGVSCWPQRITREAPQALGWFRNQTRIRLACSAKGSALEFLLTLEEDRSVLRARWRDEEDEETWHRNYWYRRRP